MHFSVNAFLFLFPPFYHHTFVTYAEWILGGGSTFEADTKGVENPPHPPKRTAKVFGSWGVQTTNCGGCPGMGLQTKGEHPCGDHRTEWSLD